jgi:formylglycine-generating enzyme required for sulfatase activity
VNSGAGATGLADAATVSSFRLDKYDVTVGRFRQFVRAWNGGAGYTPPAGSGKHTHLNGGRGLANGAAPGTFETGWNPSDDGDVAPTDANLACDKTSATWTAAAGSDERLPINCITWYEAYAFCIWDGGFLPSYTEWGYAAAGGSQQRMYPWGSADPGISNQYAIYNCYYPSGAADAGLLMPGVAPPPPICSSSLANIAPVGAAAAGQGRWGQLDLTGNMWTWVVDWFGTTTACIDCANLTAGSDERRMMRGGPFNDTGDDLLSWAFNVDSPSYRDPTDGFRCARAP